jgi:cytochrome c-type biogenesis protein CcmH/NrfG
VLAERAGAASPDVPSLMLLGALQIEHREGKAAVATLERALTLIADEAPERPVLLQLVERARRMGG